MNCRLPVIIAGTNCLSGVTSWADQLRAVLADHPRYDLSALHVGSEPGSSADIVVATLEEAHRAICRMAPAIVIPNYVWPLYLTGLEDGVRCLGMCHADSLEQYYRPLGWYEPAIAKFIAVSKECEENLARQVPMRSRDIAMLPYGVHVPAGLNRTYQAKPLRMIYAGRVTQPQKRVWDFVPLVEHLLRAKVPFVFDIVGAGDEFAPLQQIMRARIPAADVHFHGRVPHSEMAAKWLGHDVFIQVSDFEGTSVSMLEAMAQGVVPIVTAASSGIAGVINPRENGFVVPVGDMAGMAKVLAELATDQTLLAELGQAAYRTAQAYSMDLYAKRFARILDQVVEAEQYFDHEKRYGIYSPTHPLFVQRQMIQQANRPPDERENRPRLRRFLKRGLNGLRRQKSHPVSRDDRRAA
jgi:glycosyltransferase involved in cell wall biosynthesis